MHDNIYGIYKGYCIKQKVYSTDKQYHTLSLRDHDGTTPITSITHNYT